MPVLWLYLSSEVYNKREPFRKQRASNWHCNADVYKANTKQKNSPNLGHECTKGIWKKDEHGLLKFRIELSELNGTRWVWYTCHKKYLIKAEQNTREWSFFFFLFSLNKYFFFNFQI